MTTAEIEILELPANADATMRGWEAFGGVDPERENPMRLRELAGGAGWPAGELHDGVAFMRVVVWGDDPASAHVTVVGPDRDRVIATFQTAAAGILAGAGLGWFA